MAGTDLMLYDMMPRLGKNVLVVGVSSVLGTLLFAYLHFSETNYFPRLSESSSGYVSSGLIGCVIGYALYFSNRYLDRWLPWRRVFTARFIVGYFVSFTLAMGLVYILTVVFVKMFSEHVFWKSFMSEDEDMQIKVAILFSTLIFIYTVVYALLYSYQQYAVAQLETLQRERKQMELQFEALKSQLSPHYLFNSLNTISSLIYKDTPSAEQFIRRLAQTYRYILSTQHKRFVTLREEVEFVQSYYYLLRIRFQQQLNLEINLPSSILNSRIPPLTLQILVENAVKHNTITSEHRLFIYITAQDNTCLRVINTKIGTLHQVPSFRLGLENIKKRYQFFTNREIEIRDEDNFSVTLPVLPFHQQQTSIDYKHSA